MDCAQLDPCCDIFLLVVLELCHDILMLFRDIVYYTCGAPNPAPDVRRGCLIFFIFFLFAINLFIHILLNI